MQNVAETKTNPGTSISLIKHSDGRWQKTPAVPNSAAFHAPVHPSRRKNVIVRASVVRLVTGIRVTKQQRYIL